VPYADINTLRFVLAHDLRTVYKQIPADFSGLFQADALRYWLSTGLSGDEILRQVMGNTIAQQGNGKIEIERSA
jgi:hypothetical protein